MRTAEDRSNEPSEGSAIDAYAEVALGGGAFGVLGRAAAVDADADGHARFELGVAARSRRSSTGSTSRRLTGASVPAMHVAGRLLPRVVRCARCWKGYG
jgi:hypothetical protein